MEKLKKGKSWCWLLGALFIFVLFYYMTVRTPLAGDDWGYAVNGMSGNPFVKAWEFYFSWSGVISRSFGASSSRREKACGIS